MIIKSIILFLLGVALFILIEVDDAQVKHRRNLSAKIFIRKNWRGFACNIILFIAYSVSDSTILEQNFTGIGNLMYGFIGYGGNAFFKKIIQKCFGDY